VPKPAANPIRNRYASVRQQETSSGPSTGVKQRLGNLYKQKSIDDCEERVTRKQGSQDSDYHDHREKKQQSKESSKSREASLKDKLEGSHERPFIALRDKSRSKSKEKSKERSRDRSKEKASCSKERDLTPSSKIQKPCAMKAMQKIARLQ